LVIYTGRNAPANPHFYEKTTFGTTISYRYNTYIIVEQDEAALKANSNPFAIVVLANLYVVNTYNNYTERLKLKEEIYTLARERKYSDEKTNKILLFLFELMNLPPFLEAQFDEYISKSQNSTDMIPVTWRSRNAVDALAKQAFGHSVTEMDATIVNAILRLYTKLKLSIDEIAEVMGREPAIVTAVLKKHKLLKK
jgi:hypothetical protein